MPGDQRNITLDGPRSWEWPGVWKATLILVVVLTLARLVFAAVFSSVTLIEDEAHYWEWSRRLDWSYYTKGPGTAWSIAAATGVLGTAEWTIRVPAIIGAGLCAYWTAALARGIFASNRAGFFAACALLTSPIFQTLGLIMTIDSPYSACWAGAMLAGARAMGLLHPGRARDRAGHETWERGKVAEHGAIATSDPQPVWWLAVGAAVGVGCLYKYTMLLALVGLVLCALVVRPRRMAVGWMLAGGLVMSLTMLPIALWNNANGWPTVAHLLGHLGWAGGDVMITPSAKGESGYNPLWTLEYVGVQVVLIGPILLIVLAYLIVFVRSARSGTNAGKTGDAGGAGAVMPGALASLLATNRGGQFYLLFNAVPMLTFYLIVSFFTGTEGNWPMAGYITLFALAGGVLARLYSASATGAFALGGKPGKRIRHYWHVACAIGLAIGVIVPLLPALDRTRLLGPLIPLHRFQGADEMAAHADRIVTQLRDETGKEPFVMALHYGRASQLAYYMRGRPVVYCASSYILGGRKTQYDFFADTDLMRVEGVLLERPALVVGGTREGWEELFERVELIGTLEGDGKPNRPAFAAYGYAGVAGRRSSMGTRGSKGVTDTSGLAGNTLQHK